MEIVIGIVCFVCGWCLRELYLRQKDYTNLGLVSLIASLYAASETRALKQSPILRQYIERYIPSEKLTDEEAQTKMAEMQSEFEKMFSIGVKTKEKKTEEKTVQTNGTAPEDLV